MKLKSMLPYLVVNSIAFYLLPLLMQNTGISILIMLIVIPIISFLSSLVFGMRNGLSLVYPVVIAILFVPTIFLFYNYTAWVYVLGYGVVTLIGELIGKLFYKTNK